MAIAAEPVPEALAWQEILVFGVVIVRERARTETHEI